MSTPWPPADFDHDPGSPFDDGGTIAAFPHQDVAGDDPFGLHESLGFEGGFRGGFEAGIDADFGAGFVPGARASESLVVAPLPALPLRWDALDAHDADVPTRSHAADPHAELDRFGSPDPMPAAVVDFDATPIAPPSAPSLIDDIQKVCRRLLGRDQLALGIARESLATSISPEHPTGSAPTALMDAVRRCIDVALPDETTVPYHQHRARLRRDLGRRSDRDRAILALRHLVGLPPSAVAARLEVPESQVREVASAWCPADSRVDSLALLRGIDSWISSDLGSIEDAATGHELAHLDDIAP